MVPATTPFIGFSGEIIWSLGKISLLVKIGDDEHSNMAWINFVIVRSSSLYDGIIGRPRVRKIQVVPSTAYGMLKFPVARGILTLKSSKIIPIEYAAVSGPEEQPPATYQAIEERIKEGQNKLCDLLQRNLDVFAWRPADMTGVPRHIAEHRLNIREGCPLVRSTTTVGYLILRISATENRLEGGIPLQISLYMFSGCIQGLRNARATYQHLVDKAFHKQIGRNLKLIAKLPTLTAPEEKEELIDYLASTKEAVRLILTNPEGAEFTYALRFIFEATNNEAEYEALIAGLTYTVKEADMIRYLEKVRALVNGFRIFAHLSKQVLVNELKEISVNEVEVLAVVEEEGNAWMTPIYEYLTKGTLPAKTNKERAVRRKSHRFAVINGVLYKKSFLRPWLRHKIHSGAYKLRDRDGKQLLRT
ncbi:hypothetical protein Tco_0494242 [Tanacetum coccineum]